MDRITLFPGGDSGASKISGVRKHSWGSDAGECKKGGHFAAAGVRDSTQEIFFWKFLVIILYFCVQTR